MLMYIIYCNSFVIYYIHYTLYIIHYAIDIQIFFICRHLLPIGQYGVGSGYVLGGIALLAPLRAYASAATQLCARWHRFARPLARIRCAIFLICRACNKSIASSPSIYRRRDEAHRHGKCRIFYIACKARVRASKSDRAYL